MTKSGIVTRPATPCLLLGERNQVCGGFVVEDPVTGSNDIIMPELPENPETDSASSIVPITIDVPNWSSLLDILGENTYSFSAVFLDHRFRDNSPHNHVQTRHECDTAGDQNSGSGLPDPGEDNGAGSDFSDMPELLDYDEYFSAEEKRPE